MEQGKCEDCGAPTKLRQDGEPWRKCWKCKENEQDDAKAKKLLEEMPVKTAQEQINDICATFKMCADWIMTTYPKADPEIGFQVAMHLNNQYWKNDRTPR